MNNSGDDLLFDSDWYQHRLWCLQEYCLPSRLTLTPIVDLSRYSDLNVLEERKEVQGRFFGSSGLITSCEVILDWLPSCQENLKEKIQDRVRQVGCAGYIDLVARKHAADRNDTFSALAQPWFGIIMTSKNTKLCLAQALIDEALAGVSEHEEIALITNTTADGSTPPVSGSMVVERMMSGPPSGMETGERTEVR